MTKKTPEFWTSRYENDQTGWDLGQASPPLIDYCKELDRSTSILIPGAGNAHEYATLTELGFKDLTILDISHFPIAQLKSKYPAAQDSFINGDFFEHQERYDLILEQTFFCAISPSLRYDYARHAASLLKSKGRLAGLLFKCDFEREGPPHGGSVTEYQDILGANFSKIEFTDCNTSVGPRLGNEVFFEASN